MTKAVSELVNKIETGYGKKQFEVTFVFKDTETNTYHIGVKELLVEEDA
jgi:hypothetical protein